MKSTTLILESKDYSKKALAVYESLGRVFLYPELHERQKKEFLYKANILVVRLAHMIDAEWLDRLPNLKIIATPTTGLNHIDLREAEKRSIKIISLRGRSSFLKNIPSTAELTVGLILALARKIPWAFEDVKKGHWRRDIWKGHQLYGKTLGLFGCGRLGKLVARHAKTFGMHVIGYDPYISAEKMKRAGIKKTGEDDLFKNADIVSVHALLTDETRDIITKKHLRMMKPTAYLVNTARGEIIEACALERALEKKWIAGAAIDVMRDEWADGSHLRKNPLLEYAKTHDNFIIVPHIGGATYEAMHATEEFVAELVKNKLWGGV